MESVGPKLQILRLPLGWIGTMNLTKRRPVAGFNDIQSLDRLDRLDHESGMSSKAEGLGEASKRSGQ